MSRFLPPVDDDVFEALQALAEPLVDDVNSVLRRVLGLPAGDGQPRSSQIDAVEPQPEETSTRPPPSTRRSTPKGGASAKKQPKVKKARAPRGSLLPESEYELPILEYLVEVGGRAPSSEVVEAIGARLKDRFTPTDLQSLDSGDLRWRSRTQFVRLKLIREGTMVKDAPRGIWEISDAGRARVKGAVQ